MVHGNVADIEQAPARDCARTIVVASRQPDMAAALAGQLDRHRVVVRPVWPEDLEGVLGEPSWPWMVIGDEPVVSAGAAAWLRRRPVLLLWRGTVPEALPGHVHSVRRWVHVHAMIVAMLNIDVAGMRLAIDSGVTMPSGRRVRSPRLQALISQFPEGWDLPLSAFDGVTATLAKHAVPWAPMRSGELVVFAPSAGERL